MRFFLSLARAASLPTIDRGNIDVGRSCARGLNSFSSLCCDRCLSIKELTNRELPILRAPTLARDVLTVGYPGFSGMFDVHGDLEAGISL